MSPQFREEVVDQVVGLRVPSSTSAIAHAATIGFVVEASRQIVSAAIGVLDPAPRT